MIISKDSTPEQKEALRQALRQQSLQMAVRGAAPEDIQSLPEDFEPPQYSENTRQLYDVQLFPQIKSADDLIANGYATPDGQPTEQGQMAISLKKVGALNDDYTLNDTGRAMMSSREDLLQPENLNLYAKAKDLKLDDGDDLTFSQNVAELWGKAKDLSRAVDAEIDPYSGAIQAIGSIASGPLGLPKAIAGVAEQISEGLPSKEERAAATIRRQTAVDEFSEQGVQTLMGAGELMLKGVLNAPATMPFGVTPEFLDEATKDQAILAANQTRERINNEVQKVSSAEAIDDLTGFTNFVGAYQEAENLLGQEKTQEAIKEGEALGLAASIINPAAPEAIAFGVGLKAAGRVAAPFSGAMFRAEQKAAQVFNGTKTLANLQKQAADYQFVVGAAEKRAIQAEQTADKLSRAGFVDRANNARLAANRIRMQGQEAGQKFGSLQDEIARVSDDLSMLSRDATVADKVVQLTQKAKDLPFQSISGLGKAIEYTGRGMIGIDKGLSNLAAKVGVDKAYNAMNKVTTLSGLGTVASAAGLGPVAFAPAAIKTAWSTAPFIKATGEYVGMLGREAAKARGQIGFWKRVYNMPNQGFTQNMIAGLADTATLGGNLTGLGVRTGKGVLSSIPADLAFNYVAEGGNMDMGSINQALAESVFFGGTGAALGGITMGSKNRIRSLQNGDALNFYRSIADPNQRVIFNGMSGDLKRAIGTFSASYPGSQILFSNEGAGSYDRNTKMLVINPNSRNPLKPLLTHEFLHHILNNGTGDAIVANLVGDGYQTGGILRNKDGSYDSQYEQFKTEYVNDLRRQHERNVKLKDAIGDPMSKAERIFKVPDEKYLAEEYFIENNVDDMLGLVESGKLGKMAGRMIISDKMRSLGDAIINKSAVLKDLHFRLGGMMDSNGKMVVGNGFLGGQLYQSPEIRRMFKRMVNESVGRKAGVDAAKNKARNGIEIQVTGKRDPILYSLDSLWESDGDNPLQDKNGDLVPLKKETEELRSTAGLLVLDDYEKRRARGDTFEPGELAYNPENNTWSGSFLTDNQIKLLKISGRFSNVQIKQLELLNSAAKTNSDPNAAAGTRGNRFSMFYQPALKKNRKGQWRYDQIKPQLRDVVPYGIEISKDGNILIRVMSTNQLFANATEKAATKRGRLLYQGNIDAILTDANAMIDAHGKEIKPETSDRHFKEKYGSQWEEHKKFINSVFGNVGAGHKDINPLVSSDRVDAVVKSYRLDRINKSTQLVGSTKIPYQNNLIKINYLPEGEPILDANGEPKDLRYTPRYEERMPEQRQMPEGGPAPTGIDGIRKQWDDLGIQHNLSERSNEIEPGIIKVPPSQRNQGIGNQAMSILTQYADKVGKRIVVSPTSEFGANKQRLVNWYKGLGFVENKGRNKDYSTKKTMYREPTTAPSQRFMPEKLDADYMKAVESGDVGEQQRLVDEVAKKAGYVTGKAFHSTKNPRQITQFITTARDALGAHFGLTRRQAVGPLGRHRKVGKGVSLYEVYLNATNPIRLEDRGTWSSDRVVPQINEQLKSSLPNTASRSEIVSLLRENGYDSAIYENRFEGKEGDQAIIVFDPSQIKSADPITRDDSGNIIPPSKRFDITSKDLRFMPEAYRGEHTAPTTESAPASDLTSNGVYPADVYTRPDWYEQDDGLEEMRKIQRLKGKPDSPVWIHRAVPLDVAEEAMKSDTPLRYVFRGGDWVTTSKQYAKDHGESALNGKYRVFSKRVKAKDIYTNGDSIFEWGYNPEETEQAETMPAINQPTKTGQMRFLPEPVEKLSAFKGKRVQVLTSDLSLVGDVKYGDYTARFQGGPGYLDNDGWGFTDKDAADGFVTRWKRDGKPLIGLASLGSGNHLNSLESRKSYAEKWKYLIQSGKLNKSDVDDHIKDAMSRIINSEAKKVKTDWVNAAKMIENADDLANYFDKIPWAAAPMFYEKLTAKTLPIKYSTLVENGLDLESVAREYRQPEYESADLGDLYAIAEYDGSEPEYSPDLNRAYPWRIKFKKKATLSEMHNVADLTTDPRAFTGKKVGAKLAPQPLMVTGVQLDKLMSGDIKPSGKPVSLKKDTPKTKSNKATEFSTGNPKAYKSYEQIIAERELEKPKPKKKSTAKGNPSAIANAAKLK